MDRPFSAYRGSEPFSFVCYAHEDANVVYPELATLHERGLNLWYDEGISAGRNWREEIGVSLLNAERLLFYISRASLASEHCNREINLALDEGKVVVPVYLEDVELTPDLKVGLARVQALQRQSSDNYHQQLISALGQSDANELPRAAPERKHRIRRYTTMGLAIAFLAGLAAWYGTRVHVGDGSNQAAETSTPASIGVRAFSSLGDDPALARYAALVTDDVKASLADTSVRLVTVDPAAGISADYIVDGRVRTVVEGTRLTIELRRSIDGEVAWATTLDDPTDPSATVQFERAPFVARMVETTLVYLNTRRLLDADGATSNSSALDAFFAGMTGFSETQMRAGGDWILIVNHFKRAVELDPELGPAYNMLAVIYATRLGATLTAAEALPEAHRWVQKSLAANPDATLALGLINLYLDLDYTAAAANYTHAQPTTDLATLESQRCMLAFAQGHLDKAIDHCKSAIAAGSAGQSTALRDLGMLWFNAGRYQDARAALEESMRNSGTGSTAVALGIKAYAEVMDGDTVAANKTIDDAWPRYGNETPDLFASPLALLGRTEEARRVLEQTVVTHRAGTSTLAAYASTFLGYYHLGEFDEAFVWLAEAIENREVLLIGGLRVSPMFDNIRTDPRFAAAMARLEEIEAQGSPTQSVATLHQPEKPL